MNKNKINKNKTNKNKIYINKYKCFLPTVHVIWYMAITTMVIAT